MAQNGVDERPLEKLVEKEVAIGATTNGGGAGSDETGRTEEALASMREQMDDLRSALSAIASTLASRAEAAKDGIVETGRSTLEQVTSTARSGAQTVASGVSHAGETAMDHATSAAGTVTSAKESAKEIPGFETMQTIATLAPIAATVARRIPGGKKMVVAGATAYAAYLLLDAVGNARDKKSKAG